MFKTAGGKELGLRAFLFLMIGAGLGMLLSTYFIPGVVQTINGNAACLRLYPLTSQSLDCANYDDSASRLKGVDTAIDTATALYIKEGRATAISVWVRDLNDAQTASTNENQRYDPASLLKLPLMIAYFKVAELDPTLLQTTLPYTDTGIVNDSIQDFAPSSSLIVGQSYTVEQLIEDMIINSDNNATAALLAHLDPSIFTQTLLDLGIKIPSSDNTGLHDFITAKSYATIFRTLYNSSYLSRDDSQKALALMSKEAFAGIAGPLPAGTVVAHKFGEREVDNMDGSVQVRELHDCGIVYKKNEPYTLCIMTQGQNFTDLLSVIQNISQIVYGKM